MAWSIELSTQAEADLAVLDRPVAQRIVRFLQERVSSLENPRTIGEPLQGARLGALWRYRVGDYCLIASIEDAAIIILIVRIGHRREVYR